MNNLEADMLKYQLNPPLVVGEALGQVIAITGGTYNGSPMKIRPDNRYKDGNIRIVNGVIRGNSKTVRVSRLELKK